MIEPGCVVSEWMAAVRRERPLVHNITNLVAMQIVANTLLAAGASPVMAHADEEVADMVTGADALVLNIGTLDPQWIRSMHHAGETALGLGRSIVLDPVGVGATPYRTAAARDLVKTVHPTVIRGNAGEIGVLARGSGLVKGVEAGGAAVSTEDAMAYARATGAVVAATGAVDLVTDGTRTASIRNGHPWLALITGTGCSLSALVGAFLAVVGQEDPSFPLEATVAGLVYFEVAAERAATRSRGPGSFHMALLDELATVDGADVNQAAQVTWCKRG